MSLSVDYFCLFLPEADLEGGVRKEKPAPSGRAVITRTTRKDKHQKYRPISEMRNALKLNQ